MNHVWVRSKHFYLFCTLFLPILNLGGHSQAYANFTAEVSTDLELCTASLRLGAPPLNSDFLKLLEVPRTVQHARFTTVTSSENASAKENLAIRIYAAFIADLQESPETTQIEIERKILWENTLERLMESTYVSVANVLKSLIAYPIENLIQSRHHDVLKYLFKRPTAQARDGVFQLLLTSPRIKANAQREMFLRMILIKLTSGAERLAFYNTPVKPTGVDHNLP